MSVLTGNANVSIVETANKRDAEALGISVMSSIAEILPSSNIVLYSMSDTISGQSKALHALHTTTDESKGKLYLWDSEIASNHLKYIDENMESLAKVSVFQTQDKHHHVFVPILVDNTLILALDVSSIQKLSGYKARIVVAANVLKNYYQILKAAEKDALTGLLNKNVYESKLSTMLVNQYKTQHQVDTYLNNSRKIEDLDYTWLAVLNIVHYEDMVKKYGMGFGNEVLLMFSRLMVKTFRKNDLLFRFEADEFAIILEPVNRDSAEVALNKLVKSVHEHLFPLIKQLDIRVGYTAITQLEHPIVVFNNARKGLCRAFEDEENICFYEGKGVNT